MKRMQDIKNKMQEKTLYLVILNTISSGLYSIIWVSRLNKIIQEEMSQEVSSRHFITWTIMCFGAGITLSRYIGYSSDWIVVLPALLTMTAYTLIVAWVFKLRKILQDNVADLKLNVFLTLLFNIYYINYVINKSNE